MTEYDYSEEGRRRYVATQNRIAKWVHQTESAPTLKSPFTPRSHTGSDATVRPPSHGPSRAGSHRPPTMHLSRGPMTQQTYRPSQAPPRPPPSAQRSQFHPPPSHGNGGSRAAPTVYPSQSISQAPMSPSPSTHHSQSSRTSSSSHRSHHSHGHQHHRSPTYIVSPPPSPGYAHDQRPHGVIILPRRGQAPSVVYY